MLESPRSYVEVLSPELWEEIILRLEESYSAVMLSQACRYLQTILATKEIWVKILRNMCLKHHLFAASYPVETMSVVEIKRAASGPQLWSKLIQSHTSASNGAIEPLEPRTSVILQPSPRAVSDMQSFVPGGRFLVTADAVAAGGAIMINLWDLGAPGRKPLCPAVLYAEAVFPIGLPWAERHGMDVWTEGEELRVAIVVMNRGICAMRVVSILPNVQSSGWGLAAEARIELIIDFGSRPMDVLLHGSRLLLRHGDNLVVWDFEKDRFVVIVAERGPVEKVVLTGDMLIILRPGGVHMWNLNRRIQDSTTRLADFASDYPPVKRGAIWDPDFSISNPLPDGRADLVRQIYPSLVSRGLPFTFDEMRNSVHPHLASAVVIRRFTVALPHGPTSVDELDVKLQATFILPWYDSMPMTRPTQDFQFGFFSPSIVRLNLGYDRDDGKKARYYLYSVDDRHAKGIVEGKLPEKALLTPMGEVWKHGLKVDMACPASGRAIFVGRQGRSYGSSLLDYFW